jgi:hypothetical protein
MDIVRAGRKTHSQMNIVRAGRKTHSQMNIARAGRKTHSQMNIVRAGRKTPKNKKSREMSPNLLNTTKHATIVPDSSKSCLAIQSTRDDVAVL